MGIYYYWGCPDKKEYIDSFDIPDGDNVKWPVFDTAMLVFECMRTGRWASVRIWNDCSDLPWENEPGWTNITGEVVEKKADCLRWYREALKGKEPEEKHP